MCVYLIEFVLSNRVPRLVSCLQQTTPAAERETVERERESSKGHRQPTLFGRTDGGSVRKSKTRVESLEEEAAAER